MTRLFFQSQADGALTRVQVCADKEARAQLEREQDKAQTAGGAVTGEKREAEGDTRRSSILQESDAAFLTKLLFTSIGGAASNLAVSPKHCTQAFY